MSDFQWFFFYFWSAESLLESRCLKVGREIHSDIHITIYYCVSTEGNNTDRGSYQQDFPTPTVLIVKKYAYICTYFLSNNYP